MRIGIDARLYGIKHTGIGRYTRNLILSLSKINKKHSFVVFGHPDIKSEISSLNRFEFVKLTTPVYSVREQFVNHFVFKKANLDLLHIPHFNAPIFYFGPMVLTIHDLIKHISIGKETSTLPPAIYWAKHWVYRLVVAINIKKSKVIITPSKFWQGNLINRYGLNAKKVHVTYEAVDKSLQIRSKGRQPSARTKTKILQKYRLQKPFIIYTGNLYPHKNVKFLIQAVARFNRTHKHQLTLAIACARDVFNEKLSKEQSIRYLGYVPDNDLAILYSQALALVHPSLIEGFGLTGLEAMAAGLPVLSSESTCLPEIYGDAALYFDPYNQQSLILRLEQIMGDRGVLENLKHKGYAKVKQFSWDKTARETIKAYNQAVKPKKTL